MSDLKVVSDPRPCLRDVAINSDGSLLAFYEGSSEPKVGITPGCRVSPSGYTVTLPMLAVLNLVIEQHRTLAEQNLAIKALRDDVQRFNLQLALILKGKDDGN